MSSGTGDDGLLASVLGVLRFVIMDEWEALAMKFPVMVLESTGAQTTSGDVNLWKE